MKVMTDLLLSAVPHGSDKARITTYEYVRSLYTLNINDISGVRTVLPDCGHPLVLITGETLGATGLCF